MIKIRYSPGEVDLSGSLYDMKTLKSNILSFLESTSLMIAFDTKEHFNPAPYDFVISKLSIYKTDGAVIISLKNQGELSVEGSVDNLYKFMSFFEFSSDAKFPQHSHYEYYSGNEYISPKSLPLIIGIEKDKTD